MCSLPQDDKEGSAYTPRLDKAIEIWSKRAGMRLTEDEVEEITRNAVGFFRVLLERKERRKQLDRRVEVD